MLATTVKQVFRLKMALREMTEREEEAFHVIHFDALFNAPPLIILLLQQKKAELEKLGKKPSTSLSDVRKQLASKRARALWFTCAQVVIKHNRSRALAASAVAFFTTSLEIALQHMALGFCVRTLVSLCELLLQASNTCLSLPTFISPKVAISFFKQLKGLVEAYFDAPGLAELRPVRVAKDIIHRFERTDFSMFQQVEYKILRQGPAGLHFKAVGKVLETEVSLTGSKSSSLMGSRRSSIASVGVMGAGHGSKLRNA